MKDIQKRALTLGFLMLLILPGCEAANGLQAPLAPSPSATTVPSPTPRPPDSTARSTAAPQSLASPSPGPTPRGEAMTVTIVYDNNPLDQRLKTEWGFACWVEHGEHIILFDTGGDGATLLDNMDKLQLDPQRIETIVLSHEHADHTGGLDSLLAVHSDVTVVMPRSFSGSLKRRVLATGAELAEVDEALEIAPDLYSTGVMGDRIIEQALVGRSSQGLVVITGCAHPGIVNIVKQALAVGQDDIQLVLGGFHLADRSAGVIQRIAGELRQMGVQKLGPTHCSGDRARQVFAEAYGDDCLLNGVGWSTAVGQ